MFIYLGAQGLLSLVTYLVECCTIITVYVLYVFATLTYFVNENLLCYLSDEYIRSAIV